MPIAAPILAAGITAAGNLASQGVNAFAQGKMNKKTRKWNEKMYAQQRTDALSDWERMNEYNHPSSVMARLREAGLNPNLVYENGAQNATATVRSSSPGSWNPKAPQFDLGSAAAGGLGAYYDTQVKQAQIDNLRVNMTVQQQEAVLKAAQTIATLASADKTKFDLGLANELKQTSIDVAKAGLEYTRAQTMMTLDKNEREAVMNSQTVKESVERILNYRLSRAKTKEEISVLKEQIKQAQTDTLIKNKDWEFYQEGVRPTDPLYIRGIIEILNYLKEKFAPGGDVPSENDTAEEAQKKGPKSWEAYRRRHSVSDNPGRNK